MMRGLPVAFLLIGAFAPALAAEGVREDMIGRLRYHVATAEDTLADLAWDNDLGYVEVVAANPGVDPWVPGEGTPIILPTGHIVPAGPRRGIVINISDQRLYFFPQRGDAQSYPLGTPTAAGDLRLGKTRVVAKRVDPTWIPPPSVRAEDPDLPPLVPPGPDNPLGSFALDLEWPNIVIHGTNRPYGIGRRVSHGCYRLYPADIAELFRAVPIGTEVTVVEQPAKAGWFEGSLYLEVHPTLEQADELEASGRFTPAPILGLRKLVGDAAGTRADRIDWDLVIRVAEERTGVPTRILD